MTLSQVYFGRHDWDMPLAVRPHPDSKSRCAAFAAALLAGQVLPCMTALGPVLAQPPEAAARAQERTQPRVGELLAALELHKVKRTGFRVYHHCFKKNPVDMIKCNAVPLALTNHPTI